MGADVAGNGDAVAWDTADGPTPHQPRQEREPMEGEEEGEDMDTTPPNNQQEVVLHFKSNTVPVMMEEEKPLLICNGPDK
jgi:hypothetical protein